MNYQTALAKQIMPGDSVTVRFARPLFGEANPVSDPLALNLKTEIVSIACPVIQLDAWCVTVRSPDGKELIVTWDHVVSSTKAPERPPQHVIDAAAAVSRYFRERNIKRWQLGEVADRAFTEDATRLLHDAYGLMSGARPTTYSDQRNLLADIERLLTP